MIPGASFYLALHHDRLTVVEAAATDQAWADRVLADRPDTQLHRLPRGSTGAFGLGQVGGIPILDRILPELGLRHLNYLRIADADAAIPVLLGARRLLSHARIDIIEIATGAAADRPMAAVIALLEPFDFQLLSPSEKLNDLLLAPFEAESGRVVLFALHRRFAGAIMGGNREPEIGALMAAHQLAPRGIIHVGAHAGEEIAAYLALGFERILMIEADPSLATALAGRFRDEPRVAVESCAITDFDGMIDLHVTSATVANSIFPMKHHPNMFAGIHETGQIRVRARTLDSLLAEPAYADHVFNIVTLDIQGAELQALRGADKLLPRLDGLLVEINFIEIYQGGAQIEEIDDHLFGHGFARVMTMSPYQSCFGDAFYLKAPAAP